MNPLNQACKPYTPFQFKKSECSHSISLPPRKTTTNLQAHKLQAKFMISPKHSHATSYQKLQSLLYHMQASESEFTSALNHKILQAQGSNNSSSHQEHHPIKLHANHDQDQSLDPFQF
jgi:hypothetical protein